MKTPSLLITITLCCLLLAACSGTRNCDRECLNETMDAYLAALVAHDPSAVSLAANLGFVENLTRMSPGEGLWESAVSGPTQFAVHIPDVEQQQAGFMGVMQRQGPDGGLQNVLLSIRLELEGSQIAEAEHLIAGVNNMQRLRAPRAGLISEVPEGSRQEYEDLVAIGLSYYDALDDNDGSLMPFADDCQRHENGRVTAGPEAGPGPNADTDMAPIARLCGPQLDSNLFEYIETIDNRRLVAADPVTGLALGFSHFHHSFENLPYLVTHTDGSTSERTADNTPYAPFDMPAAHLFKIGADGLVHEIEALGFIAPLMSPTGWE